MKKKAQIIPPDRYPQMVSKSDAVKISRQLRASETLAEGARVIQEVGAQLREGVRNYVRELEEAVDLKLFDRTTRQVELTLAGSGFERRIGRLLDEIDMATAATSGVARPRMAIGTASAL